MVAIVILAAATQDYVGIKTDSEALGRKFWVIYAYLRHGSLMSETVSEVSGHARGEVEGPKLQYQRSSTLSAKDGKGKTRADSLAIFKQVI